MKYKALMLDLDGTTIAYSDNMFCLPSPRVTEAIARAKDRIHVCIATGRSFNIVRHVIEHLGLTSPCIICNGIQLYDPKTKTMIKESPIAKQYIEQIVAVSKEFSFPLRYYNGESDFDYPPKYKLDRIMTLFFPKIHPKDYEVLEKKLLSIEGVAVHRMPSWEKGYFAVEITNANVSKLHALVDVYKILGVSKEETIGVGDSYNDYPLLSASGLKIAMGNAVPELKAIADFIAPSVEDDGVAAVIEKFILDKSLPSTKGS